ncbi:PD-(D/E)XK nuclease-like domain-containing protein [Pseudescherichia sp.]|uniref:PD-(D/E)XK nuclease-like domain-containing protein n=1 Tax=Pseudescherichia sp. TaxID=2055881 RepID=UPI0028A0C2AC|nr:PD-(D/E)XK nuclease-like domain-containing protein [Pseudescherichia sp.]
MNTYAFVIKAKAKSEKKNLFCWFSAKSDSRAEREILNILDDADIAVGRGADYLLPQRTDWHVADDLPEEGVLDDTWCDRYTLGEDGRSWSPVQGDAGAAAAPVVTVETQPTQPAADAELRPLSRLRLIQRLLAHLMHDTEMDQISLEQHIEIGVMEGKDENCFVQGLRQAIEDTPEIRELSAHVEWKLIKAVKAVFPQDQGHEAKRIATFVNDWVAAEVSERGQLVEDWLSGKLPAKPEVELDSSDVLLVENGLKIYKNDDEGTRYPVCSMPFRKQLLSQLTANELRHHLTRSEHAEITALEMDTDNGYVQNLLLVAEHCAELKTFDTAGLWVYTSSIKDVFNQEKRHELSVILQFTQTWLAAENHGDREALVREWAARNRVSTSTVDEAPPTPAAYKRAVAQNMANLSIEIAIALLFPDAVPGQINRTQLMAAKKLADQKEASHVKALKVLGKITDILEYNANSIFGVTRAIPWAGEETTTELRGLVRDWFTAHGIYENGERSKGYPEWDEDSRAGRQPKAEESVREEADSQLADTNHVMPKWVKTEEQQIAEEQGNKVHTLPKWAAAGDEQPKVESLGGGVFSIEGLLATPSNEVAKQEAESVVHVQMEETDPSKVEAGDAVPAVENVDEAAAQAGSVNPADILAAAAPELASNVAADLDQNIEPLNQDEPELPKTEPETPEIEPAADIFEPEAAAPQWPAYFEPGRYEGLPNDVYHAANGISSTQVKDARVSLMYFEARHVSKTIVRERSKVLDMGNLVHALALQPETLAAEFSIEPEIPEGALTTTATIRACIDEYNASLPPQLSADDIKALLEAHNATLPAPLPLGGSADETYASYEQLPEEYQRIENGTKHTATAMKACIKEYNATLPAPAKTTGSRDALLEQLAVVNPDLVAQEAQKPASLKVGGTKTDLIQAVKSIKPDAVFADELLDAWRENPEGKVLVTRQQLATARAIQSALLAHPTSGMLLTHPSRAVETSYFGIDEETGLEIRVRPDLEIELDGVRIGADLKTISMWDVKADALKARLRREIRMRDYHLSAAMYCETAALDQFFWIFVNKDENYHWIAIIEASAELLELGMLEYRKTMRAISTGFDTGEWPAPITEDFTDELDDFDLRRLEALRTQA